ncbi:NlpC/P60 family protein [uncultured Marinobacter sp.]|uniref:C40 family peptidase n=1 Tax=uncultured Marinobacter sp. TaxID=187379 RepID=UPI0026385143|nr:NlpC/P60 family protein [uncultured Marinobacter sp.]
MAYFAKHAMVVALVSFILGGCASNQQLQSTAPYSQYQPEEAAPGSVKADKLWQVFERYQGAPYHYGGTTGSGFDCSGFITTAYHESLGQQLPRSTSLMLRHGKAVSTENIEPGDIVFFRIAGKDQHAGIYMGDNRFIHASTSSGVIMSDLNGYYWRDRLSQARRFD